MTEPVKPIVVKIATGAQMVNLSVKTLQRAQAAGDLVFIEKEGRPYVLVSELERWVSTWPTRTRAS